MATATTTSKDVTIQIQELLEQGRSFLEEANENLAKFRENKQKGQSAFDQMAELAKQAGASIGSELSTEDTVPVSSAKPIGPRPKGSSVAPFVAKAVKPSKTAKIVNATPLNSVIWEILNRDPKTYKKHFPDYPVDSYGLKPVEIKQVVNNEGVYKTNAKDITQMVAQVLTHFKREGRISKDENTKRYFIIEGAEFNGPPLNEDGTPMKEQPDGTFKMKDGQTFLRALPNASGVQLPWKRRRDGEGDE